MQRIASRSLQQGLSLCRRREKKAEGPPSKADDDAAETEGELEQMVQRLPSVGGALFSSSQLVGDACLTEHEREMEALLGVVKAKSGRLRRTSVVEVTGASTRRNSVLSAGVEGDLFELHIAELLKEEQAKQDAWHEEIQRKSEAKDSKYVNRWESVAQEVESGLHTALIARRAARKWRAFAAARRGQQHDDLGGMGTGPDGVGAGEPGANHHRPASAKGAGKSVKSGGTRKGGSNKHTGRGGNRAMDAVMKQIAHVQGMMDAAERWLQRQKAKELRAQQQQALKLKQQAQKAAQQQALQAAQQQAKAPETQQTGPAEEAQGAEGQAVPAVVPTPVPATPQQAEICQEPERQPLLLSDGEAGQLASCHPVAGGTATTAAAAADAAGAAAAAAPDAAAAVGTIATSGHASDVHDHASSVGLSPRTLLLCPAQPVPHEHVTGTPDNHHPGHLEELTDHHHTAPHNPHTAPHNPHNTSHPIPNTTSHATYKPIPHTTPDTASHTTSHTIPSAHVSSHAVVTSPTDHTRQPPATKGRGGTDSSSITFVTEGDSSIRSNSSNSITGVTSSNGVGSSSGCSSYPGTTYAGPLAGIQDGVLAPVQQAQPPVQQVQPVGQQVQPVGQQVQPVGQRAQPVGQQVQPAVMETQESQGLRAPTASVSPAMPSGTAALSQPLPLGTASHSSPVLSGLASLPLPTPFGTQLEQQPQPPPNLNPKQRGSAKHEGRARLQLGEKPAARSEPIVGRAGFGQPVGFDRVDSLSQLQLLQEPDDCPLPTPGQLRSNRPGVLADFATCEEPPQYLLGPDPRFCAPSHPASRSGIGQFKARAQSSMEVVAQPGTRSREQLSLSVEPGAQPSALIRQAYQGPAYQGSAYQGPASQPLPLRQGSTSPHKARHGGAMADVSSRMSSEEDVSGQRAADGRRFKSTPTLPALPPDTYSPQPRSCSPMVALDRGPSSSLAGESSGLTVGQPRMSAPSPSQGPQRVAKAQQQQQAPLRRHSRLSMAEPGSMGTLVPTRSRSGLGMAGPSSQGPSTQGPSSQHVSSSGEVTPLRPRPPRTAKSSADLRASPQEPRSRRASQVITSNAVVPLPSLTAGPGNPIQNTPSFGLLSSLSASVTSAPQDPLNLTQQAQSGTQAGAGRARRDSMANSPQLARTVSFKSPLMMTSPTPPTQLPRLYNFAA